MAAAGSKMPAAPDRHCMRVRVPDQSGNVRGQKVNFAGSVNLREGVTVVMPLVAGVVWRLSCKVYQSRATK